MKSKSVSVNVTANGLAANQAQQAAGHAKSAAETAQELAYSAQKTADGKNRVFRGTDPNTVPTAGLKEGDLYFTDNALYTWTGSAWEKTVSDTTGAEIHAKVEAAMQESQKAVADLKSNVEAKVKNLDDEIAKNKIQTGNALSFYKEQYYLSTSYTELTGGSWSDEVPPRKVEGKYVWSRYVTANVGDPTNHQYSDPVCISGLDGKDGEQGPQGPQGVPGPKGADGQTTYVHVAYADSADGKSNFSVNYFADALYIGVLTDYTQADSTDYTQYTWSRLKGDTGDQGIPGPKGADGRTTYVHFAYANITQLGWEYTDFTLPTQAIIRFGNEDLGKWIYKDLPAGKYIASHDYFGDPAFGQAKAIQVFSDFSVTESSGRAYIGQYTDYTQADSTDPASYKWTKIKGETGPTGATGPQGPTGATGPKGDTGDTGFFIGTTPPPNPTKGTVWATNDSSGNMTSAKTWNGSAWVSTAFTQDLVAGNITATKIVGGELDVNKITIKNAQNIPITSTVSLGDKLSNIEQDAGQIKLTSMAGQGLDLVDGLDGEFVMGGGIPSTTWKDGNAYLALPISIGDYSEALPLAGTQFATLYNWEAGKTYTQSIVIETDAQINTGAQPQWTWSENGPAWIHNIQPAELVSLGNNCYRLIGSYTPNSDNTKAPLLILDIWNLGSFVNLATGTYLKFRSPHFFCADDSSLSQLKLASDSLNAYVKGSKGSKTLESILSMDPDHSSIAQVVNGQIAAAIGTYSDGSVRIDGKALYINSHAKIDDATIKSAMIDSIEADKIKTGTLDADHVRVINLDASSITTGRLSGKNIELDGNTTVTGRLDLMKKDRNWIAQSTNYHNNWTWRNAHIYFDNYLQLQGENCDVTYTDTNTHLGGTSNFYSITTLTPGYLKFTTYQNKISDDDESFDGQISRSYLDSGRLETPEVHTGKIALVGYKIKSRDGGSLYVSNKAGGNFDNNGSVGFQVWGGIGLGENTIYMPSNNLYVQQGNCGPGLGARYSDSGKVQIHCQKIISQEANTVSSRLSVKTDITPVSYDRALAAVEGTDMYDYRYVSDDSGQHYVSGIIDDVNADPQYHMDDMLINKERTARIDANLVGYHHVVIQKLLERVAALEEKAK
ncbi:hypothetical protein [Lactobacillus delbrueckii]|uniref:hypothetical protein n=1 Tax=Lactobacillus delbrueckii TaxID=1584 RepID=UPI0020859844|nr:hypothetical protein [Lactobacillus delbrueckii]GHN50780.1 hypothetical protein ME801_04490 [Lactobacillus delbrueckii]